MGVIFKAKKDGETIIKLTKYSLENIRFLADICIHLPPKFNDLTRDIILTGEINPFGDDPPPADADGDAEEADGPSDFDSVRKLANWAIIPEYEECCLDAEVTLTNAMGDVVKEDSYENLYTVAYKESFDDEMGHGRFMLHLREREIKPV